MVEKYLNKITEGDCLTLLGHIPDNSIDVTFADPPFNLRKKYKSTKDKLELQNYLDWCEKWIIEMTRVTKPNGSILLHNIPKWLTFYTAVLSNIAHFRHWISWDAPTSPMGKTLQPSHYGILFYSKDAKQNKFYEIRYPHKRCRKCNYMHKDYGGKKRMLHPFGPLLSDVWTDIHRIKHNKYRDDHPCQLPIHLLERVILMTTDVGDIVLDPFLGTGTTALAAKRLGRNFIGFELDKEYVDISEGKLLQEEPTSKIGNAWVSFYLNEIVTLRDIDWEEISQYYIIPDAIQDIDNTNIAFMNGRQKGYKPKHNTHLLDLPLFTRSE